jgi:hypothetical protein
VGETEVGEVRRQPVDRVRELVVRPEAAVGVALPRAEVHLVDGHRLVDRDPLAALGEPGVVLPDVSRLEHP